MKEKRNHRMNHIRMNRIRAAMVSMAVFAALGISACHMGNGGPDMPESVTGSGTESHNANRTEDSGGKDYTEGHNGESRAEGIGESRTEGSSGERHTAFNEGEENGSLPEGAQDSPTRLSQDETRQLTEEELGMFQEYLNQAGHYGFLLSEYQSPEYINLDEVFYSGAGLEQAPMNEAESTAFLQAIGATGIETDMVRLDRAQIDAFLKDKTGISLDQMKNELSWVYLLEYDRYYTQHGDTNMRSFFCPKGEVKGNEYRIWCLSDGYSQIGLESIVTLKKVSSGYHFCSNEFIWDHFGYWKKGVDAPTAEALHFAVLSYNGDLVHDPAVMDQVDYNAPVFDSDSRYYSRGELQQISWKPGLLSVFRNEIYARHGYIFKNEVLNEFFSAYSWYHGEKTADTFDDGVFNEYEKANLKLAVEIER